MHIFCYFFTFFTILKSIYEFFERRKFNYSSQNTVYFCKLYFSSIFLRNLPLNFYPISFCNFFQLLLHFLRFKPTPKKVCEKYTSFKMQNSTAHSGHTAKGNLTAFAGTKRKICICSLISYIKIPYKETPIRLTKYTIYAKILYIMYMTSHF